MVDVLLWERWPSYDFIFGIPANVSPMAGKEAAFFQYRDSRTKRVKAGFFADEKELKIIIDGFLRCLNAYEHMKSQR